MRILLVLLFLHLLPEMIAAQASGRASAPRADVHPEVRARPLVPPVAPDSVPTWVFAAVNTIPYGGRNIRVQRNVITVSFRTGTSQEDREAAIDLVDGEVIGGRKFSWQPEGIYYVRIPGDSTGEAVLDASDLVHALAQVLGSNIIIISRPSDHIRSRQPNDGDSLRKQD